MIPSAIKNGGQWCSECANKRRGNYQLLDIDLMKEIAKQRGGKCLSSKYMGAHVKLDWQCILGHTFEAKVLIERWRKEYNTFQPHSALGYLPPAQETVESIQTVVTWWKLSVLT